MTFAQRERLVLGVMRDQGVSWPMAEWLVVLAGGGDELLPVGWGRAEAGEHGNSLV